MWGLDKKNECVELKKRYGVISFDFPCVIRGDRNKKTHRDKWKTTVTFSIQTSGFSLFKVKCPGNNILISWFSISFLVRYGLKNIVGSFDNLTDLLDNFTIIWRFYDDFKTSSFSTKRQR
jgi:hypothetical protein